MQQIRKIKLTKLTLQGFKGITEPQSFSFSSTTLIEADNGQGKSSILEAIVFAFTGGTFWGDNKNERLMNNNSKKMQVELYFTDENSTAHTLIRRRASTSSSIAFNGISVRQADLIEIFGEKDCFLSIVNPLYFIEQMAVSNGRDFLLKLLPVVNHEDIMLSLGEYHRSLLADESLLEPATYVKNCRVKIREMEDTKTYTQGQIDTLSKKLSQSIPTHEELEKKLGTCKSQLEEIEASKPKLQDASVLEREKLALSTELDAIIQSKPELKDCAPLEIRFAELKGQYSVLKSQQYTSGITDLLGGIDLELQTLRQEWSRLNKLMNSIIPGSACPACMHDISNEHINRVKTEILKEKAGLKASAEPLTKRREWLLSQDNESRENFKDRLSENFKVCEDEMNRLSRELLIMKSENNIIIKNFSDKKEQRIQQLKKSITEQEQQINTLKDDFQKQLLAYEEAVSPQKTAFMKEIDEIHAFKHARTEEETSSKEVSKLSEALKSIQTAIENLDHKIDAAIEYAAKRAELALKPLKMSRVVIKLQEVVKSTGEIVNTFRFTYDGRDYRILSLSEKLRAGLEVSNLIQQLTGRCYPVLVDNSESITSINNLDVSGQVILSRVVPGAYLSVKNLPSAQEKEFLPLRKAG